MRGLVHGKNDDFRVDGLVRIWYFYGVGKNFGKMILNKNKDTE